MKALTQSVLAAAMLVAFPFAAAEACNFNAWNGNTAATAGSSAAGPAASQRRYQGLCSLSTTAGQFVTDNTPSAETTYQALFYVYTGGNGKIFSATTANSNGGTEAVGVSYNGSQFTFSGVTGVAPITAAPSRWYGMRITYQSGGAFSAEVQGNGAATPTTSTGTAPSASISSASLGFIGAGTGAFVLDSFESTRSTTPIARLCRGDANSDGVRNVVDVIQVRNEAAAPTVSITSGTPDFNEDGVINVSDVILIRNQAALSPACA